MLQYIKSKYKVIGIIFLTLVVLILTFFVSNKGRVTYAEEIEITKVESTDTTNEKSIYKVDIKGEIVNPGVYEVSLEDRVIDVINKAGGLTENANTSNINLSKKVADELVIIIYSKEQINNDNPYEIQETTTNSNLISLNNATVDELMSLPGIGQAKASAIIKYRENNAFKSIEDIKNVSGIGDSVFEKIKDYITT